MFKEGKFRLSPRQYIECYKDMLRIRRFEERCGQLYGMGLIGGFCHLYIGQEAVATAFNYAKTEGDSAITSYRSHAHTLLAGASAKSVMAELTGRAAGCSRGKGGSMHMFDVAGKFYGGHGIVGAQVPIGTGIAFAEKYQGTSNVCLTFLGDGAINQGQVYEAFNMAALWQLPVLYVIENNEYSMGTSVERSTAMTELYRKGESFNIAGVQVDGMDINAVYNVAMQAIEYIRVNQRPLIVECKTYRFKGHSMSDPAKYRQSEEVSDYKLRDPLKFTKDVILKNSYATESQMQEIEAEIKQEITEAVEFAMAAPEPDASELMTDIFKSRE